MDAKKDVRSLSCLTKDKEHHHVSIKLSECPLSVFKLYRHDNNSHIIQPFLVFFPLNKTNFGPKLLFILELSVFAKSIPASQRTVDCCLVFRTVRVAYCCCQRDDSVATFSRCQRFWEVSFDKQPRGALLMCWLLEHLVTNWHSRHRCE